MFRKSNKQRRAEIKAARLQRAKKAQGQFDLFSRAVPAGTVAADHAQLTHVCTMCHCLPAFYIDRPFTCRDCGSEEIWTAKQQKWWYEIAKGHIDSVAIRCRPCRKEERARRTEARNIHLAGLERKARTNSVASV